MDSHNYQLRDGGKRTEFDTGSKRDTSEGKGRPDLIPMMVLFRDAILYQKGSYKYGDKNWEKGQPSTRYLESLFRHMILYVIGDRREDHVAAGRWNWGGIGFNEYMSKYGQTKEIRDKFIELHDLLPNAYLPQDINIDDLDIYEILSYMGFEKKEE